MKKSRFNAAVLTTTAISFVALALIADDKYPATRSEQKSTTTTTTSTSATGNQVTKINKASQLVGMTVKNPQGEKLGKIDDMVIDFTGDKISYCVLSVSQGAFSTDKLHAVPLRAFQPSADGTYLTLNADKEKLAQAPGFDKENWPSPNNPSWGAQPFWQEQGSKAIQKDNDSTPDKTPSTDNNP